MAAKLKYCLDGSEAIIKDLPAVPDTYADGEVLKAGVAEDGGVSSMGVGTGSFIGVSNEGSTLSGTQAAGTIENLKVIVNPLAVYGVPYDISAGITTTVGDTSIAFTCASGEGFDSMGGGWVYDIVTGALDYVVSSAVVTTTCTLTTVTGTDQTSASGVLIQPAGAGLVQILELNADALKIDADQVDVGVVGTNGINAFIMENVVSTKDYGNEILRPAVMNQQVRTSPISISANCLFDSALVSV